jgi:hypothetical protein
MVVIAVSALYDRASAMKRLILRLLWHLRAELLMHRENKRKGVHAERIVLREYVRRLPERG